jgi:peptidoglycan/LPS O-acetylase OafA/YrhL
MTIAVDTARPKPSRHHLAALDGLRGLAILLVLLHGFDVVLAASGPERAVDHLLDVGWSGVQLFFVLSGFLITGILLDTRESPDYYRSFFVRRVLRIFPLYYGVLFVAFAIVPLLAAVPLGYGQHQIWLWTYLSNYVAPFGRSESSFPHFWSLCVEEQFYLAWPLLVRLGGIRGVTLVSAVVVVVAALSRLYLRHHFGEPIGHEAAYMFTPCRADALAIGAFAAVAVRTPWLLEKLRAIGPTKLVAAGIGVLLIGLFVGGGRVAAPMQLVGYPIIACGFALLLLACLRGDAWPARLLSFAPLRRCGIYSYGMYVFYAPLHLFVGLPLLGRLQQAPTFVEAIGYEIAAIAATFALGAISYHFYEQHFLALKSRLAPVGAA